MGLIDEMNFQIRHELSQMRVPFDWQFTMVTGLWCLLGLMLLRLVHGWPRIASLAAVSLVLAKVFGLLPAA